MAPGASPPVQRRLAPYTTSLARERLMKIYRPVPRIACIVLAFGARHPVIAQSAPAPSSGEPGANQSPPPVVDVAIPNDSATELAKKLKNPIGDLISVTFQNNLNFNVGPHQGTQDILNIQPVIPFHLNEDWNVITRTILPLVWNPSFSPAPLRALWARAHQFFRVFIAQ